MADNPPNLQQLRTLIDQTFTDNVRAFMRLHGPSAHTAHLRGELQELVEIFQMTSQDLPMQRLLHLIHTQYNLDGLMDEGFLNGLTGNIIAYTESHTAQYHQNSQPTTASAYQDSTSVQSWVGRPCTIDIDYDSDVAMEDEDISQIGAPPTYTYSRASTNLHLRHALQIAHERAPATNAEALTYVVQALAEAAHAALRDPATSNRWEQDRKRTRTVLNHRYRPHADEVSRQVGNVPASNLPALPRYHYPNEPHRCHPPGFSGTTEVKDKDRDWMLKCDLCGHAIHYISEFVRHFKRQPGIRDGFKIVHIEAGVWYGVDGDGNEYMGHVLYQPMVIGTKSSSAIPSPCGERVQKVAKAAKAAAQV